MAGIVVQPAPSPIDLKALNWTPGTSGWYPESIGHAGPQTGQQPMPQPQQFAALAQMLMSGAPTSQPQPAPKGIAHALMARGRERAPVPRKQPEPVREAPVPRQRPAEAQSETYRIKKGDNLTKIAKKFGTTVEALVKANGIKDANKIFAGEDLVIPKG